MLSADRIISSTARSLSGLHQMILNMPRLLNEAAKGPLRIGASRVKEYTETLGHHVRIDPFTY